MSLRSHSVKARTFEANRDAGEKRRSFLLGFVIVGNRDLKPGQHFRSRAARLNHSQSSNRHGDEKASTARD
jgi:hypothetical protein